MLACYNVQFEILAHCVFEVDTHALEIEVDWTKPLPIICLPRQEYPS